MSQLDRVRAAIPELADASDSDVLGELMRRTGRSYEDVANTLGVPVRGTTTEALRQVGKGLVVNTPETIGKSLQYFGEGPGVSEPTSPFPRLGGRTPEDFVAQYDLSTASPAYRAGVGLRNYAEQAAPGWAADYRGKGIVGQTAIQAGEAIGTMLPVVGLSAISPATAGLAAGAYFGGSSAQDTYEKILRETGDEEAALAAARRVGVTQGFGDAFATAVGGRLFTPMREALVGAKTTADVARAATGTSFGKEFAKRYATAVATETATEPAQDVTTELIERAYGAKPEDIAQIAADSARVGFGVALLLGASAAPTSAQRARQAAKLREDLTSEDADTRKKATDYVAKVARAQGIDDADIGAWVNARLEEEKANAIKMQAEQEQNLLALEAPAQPLGIGYTPPAPADLSQPIVAGYTPTEGQGELFGFGGEAPPAATGEQIDMFGGGGQILGSEVDQTQQPDLFTQEPAYQTRLTADTLKTAGLSPRSRYYRQLIGKDMADPAQQQEIGVLFQRLLDDKNISQGTKDAVDNLRMQAFGGLAQQRSMVGPRGGALPKGGVVEQQQLTQEQQQQPPATTLPIQPLGAAAGPGVAEVSAREAAAQEAAAAEAAQQAATQEAARPMPTLTAQEQKIIEGIDNVLAANPEEGEQQAMQAMRDRVVNRARAREEQAVQSNIPTATTTAPAAKPTATDSMSSSERAELADTLSNLEARVASEGGSVKGKISLPKSVLGGLARMIRSTKTMPPIAYVPKSASEVDKQATQQYGEQMGSIRDAAKAVVEAAKKLFDYEASIIPSESKAALQIPGAAPMSDAQKEKRAFEIADDTVANITKRRAQLANAIENLRSVAGSDINVEAIIAVTKSAIQKGQQKSQAAAKAKAERSTDALLSTAWRRFKDGSLTKAEEADVTRGTEQRLSRESEARGAEEQPIVSAVEEGYARRPYKEVKIRKGESIADFNERQRKSSEAWENSKEKGVAGALAYIQRHGTAFERLISASIGRALRNPKLKNAQPGVVWISEGEKPYYDPKKNVVGVHRKASPEELMHESLHAALQWFVYSNPESYEVRSLLNALDKVLSYKGDIPAKAQEVIDVLRTVSKGKSKTARLDAVLELISYGTTLSDFRNFLKTMESGQIANEGLMSGMSALWKRITALVQRMLGVSNTVANDVLDGTVALLESAAMEAAVPAKRSGSKLYSGVITGDPNNTPQQQKLADEDAQAAGFADARNYNNVSGKWRLPTQMIFEAIGLGRVNGKDLKLTGKIKETSAAAAEYIRKNMPTLERAVLNFNSRFSNGALQNELIENFKTDQNTGYLQMERVAQHLRSNKDDAKPFLDYMDGNKKALDGLGNRGVGLKVMADSLRKQMRKYIDSLPAGSAERRAFENVPFSEYLLHPSNVGQVAGVTFGISKLKGMLGIKRRGEPSVDEFIQWLDKDKNGDVLMDQPLYQVLDSNGEPFGFISRDQFNKNGTPAGTSVDTSLIWKIEQWKDGAYKFSASMTARQVREGLDTEKLTAALLNTTAALAHNYASRNFISGMASIGRNPDGSATASTVAFNDVNEINSVFPDRKISDTSVLNVTGDSDRSPEIRLRTQRTGTWVKLPNTKTYGEMAGKIVAGPVWNSMIDMHDRSPLIASRAFNGSMSLFKKSKTIYNPGTHVTNILTNVTLAAMHGLQVKSVTDAARLFAQFEFSPKSLKPNELALMQAFYDSGAVLGNYSSSEVKRTVYEQLSKAITPDSDRSTMTKMAAFAKYESLKAKLSNFDDKAVEIYAAEDNIFRLAAFMSTAGNIQLRDGTTKLNEAQLREAGIAARKMFLDYDIDARAIRAMRQSFMPFISWSYAIMPVLGRIAIEKPWTMANVLLGYGMMQAALGGDDDEEMRKNAPEYLRERALGGLGPYMHMRIPFLGDDENPVYFNLGKYIPMFTLFQPSPAATKIAGQEWVPGFITPSGPFITLFQAMSGTDPFTGKPITDPTDSQWEKLVKTTGSMYDIMAPSMISSRNIQNTIDLAEGKVGPTGVEKSPLYLARALGGLGLYQFNVDESLFFQDLEVKRIKRDFSTAMNKAKRLEMSKGYPDYEALDAELEILRDRLEKRIAELRGEE